MIGEYCLLQQCREIFQPHKSVVFAVIAVGFFRAIELKDAVPVRHEQLFRGQLFRIALAQQCGEFDDVVVNNPLAFFNAGTMRQCCKQT